LYFVHDDNDNEQREAEMITRAEAEMIVLENQGRGGDDRFGAWLESQ
jgi:hypothetical protein